MEQNYISAAEEPCLLTMLDDSKYLRNEDKDHFRGDFILKYGNYLDYLWCVYEELIERGIPQSKLKDLAQKIRQKADEFSRYLKLTEGFIQEEDVQDICEEVQESVDLILAAFSIARG